MTYSLSKFDRPKSKKPSGAQRRKEQRQGEPVDRPSHKVPPRRPQERRAPDVQIARGPTTSETYLKLRRAHKQHTTVQYQQRWYYVAMLKINDERMFEAKLIEAV